MVETWRAIPGYSRYQVNSEGQFRKIYPSGKIKEIKAYAKVTSRRRHYIVRLVNDEGKRTELSAAKIVAEAFIGKCPEGMVPVHKNRCQSDNYVQNLVYMDRCELGKKYGGRASCRAVAKIDCTGEIVEIYPSAREAGRQNYMAYQTIMDRCNGKVKSAFAPDGYAYAWEDSEASMKRAMAKIEKETGFMPKARRTEFDF
jgi:hypothetical protein